MSECVMQQVWPNLAWHTPISLLSGFAEVGHHILPTFPLDTVCARKCSAPLAQQVVVAPPVLGSFNVRRKRGGVVCHTLDRGMVRAIGLGFEADAEPVGFEYSGQRGQEGRLGRAGVIRGGFCMGPSPQILLRGCYTIGDVGESSPITHASHLTVLYIGCVPTDYVCILLLLLVCNNCRCR